MILPDMPTPAPKTADFVPDTIYPVHVLPLVRERRSHTFTAPLPHLLHLAFTRRYYCLRRIRPTLTPGTSVPSLWDFAGYCRNLSSDADAFYRLHWLLVRWRAWFNTDLPGH